MNLFNWSATFLQSVLNRYKRVIDYANAFMACYEVIGEENFCKTVLRIEDCLIKLKVLKQL